MTTTAEAALLDERRLGRARTGTVTIRSFDEGVVGTLGALIWEDNSGTWVEREKMGAADIKRKSNYFLNVPGIDPPQGLPGIPVTWSNPEDIFEKYKLPVVLVRRDDMTPAMQRWHSVQMGQYRTPAAFALPVTVQRSNGQLLMGYDRYEEQFQAIPFDFTYTVEVQARHRGAPGIRNQVNLIFMQVLKTFPPYGRVLLTDSLGDQRSYEAFMEGTTQLDEVSDVARRKLDLGVTLRVEGELDLADPKVRRAVTTDPTFRMSLL